MRKPENKIFRAYYHKPPKKYGKFQCPPFFYQQGGNNVKVTFAPNLAKKLNSSFYYFNLLFQLSVVNPENFKEINAWEVLKFLKTKPEFCVTLVIWPNHYGNR